MSQTCLIQMLRTWHLQTSSFIDGTIDNVEITSSRANNFVANNMTMNVGLLNDATFERAIANDSIITNSTSRCQQ